MNDVLHGALKWIDYNRYLAIGLVLALAATAWLVGCQARTTGLIAQEAVTRPAFERQVISVEQSFAARNVALQAQIDTLNTEIAAANADIEAGRSHLDRQDEFRGSIVKFVGGALADAAAGTIDPGGLVTSALLLLSAGAGLGTFTDNIRKNGKIKELKAGNGTA